MKILYTAYVRFPSERAQAVQIAHMMNAFIECGDDATLLTTARTCKVDHSFEEYFGIKQLFSHQKIWIPEWSVSASIFTKLWQIYFAICCVFRVLKQRPELVYSRDEWTLYILSLFFPKLCLVWESHEAKWNIAARRLFKKDVQCVVISEGIRDAYLALGVKENLLIVAHDAIDSAFLEASYTQKEAREYLGVLEDEKWVLYIGGLDTWKGVDVLCQARETFSSAANLHVVGGSDNHLKEYRERYPKVSFLGFRPYAKLPLVQQAADVLVIPNTAKNELSSTFTSPLKLYTYMTSRVPIVASDVPSIRNVLGEGSCFYFTPDDPQSLGEAIKKALSDKEKVSEYTQKARKLVEGKTWKKRADAILETVVIQ